MAGDGGTHRQRHELRRAGAPEHSLVRPGRSHGPAGRPARRCRRRQDESVLSKRGVPAARSARVEGSGTAGAGARMVNVPPVETKGAPAAKAVFQSTPPRLPATVPPAVK